MDADGGRAHGVAVRGPRAGRDPTAKRFGENADAALLLIFTLAAVLWANSPWAHTYSEFWETPVGLTFGTTHAELTVKELVNEIREGRRTPEVAARILAPNCSCGVFNPVRAAELLEAAASK